MNHKASQFIVVAVCLLFANSTLFAQDLAEQETAVQTSAAQASFSKANGRRSIRSYGLAIPSEQVVLRSALEGHVRELLVTEGQFVKKGDPVLQLESRHCEAKLKIAKLEAAAVGTLENAVAELETARANFRRIESLKRQGVTSSQEFSEAELRLKRSEAALKIEKENLEASNARLEMAEAELEQYVLRAPFDGQVVQVQTGTGASVTQSKDLIQIVSLDKYRVDLFLPVGQANQLSVGSKMDVQVTSPFKKTIEAKVEFRSPLIEAATGTTRVTLSIDNRDSKLPSGFTVSL